MPNHEIEEGVRGFQSIFASEEVGGASFMQGGDILCFFGTIRRSVLFIP